MLFNKNPDERKKEIRLNVWQLEKLIERALDNSNNSIIAFEKSLAFLYNSSEEELSRQVGYVAEFSNSERCVKHNNDILTEIEKILTLRQMQTPSILRVNLKKIKGINDQLSIRFRVYHRVDIDGDDPLRSFLGNMTLNNNIRDDLAQVLTLLTDFQDLFQMQFSRAHLIMFIKRNLKNSVKLRTPNSIC